MSLALSTLLFEWRRYMAAMVALACLTRAGEVAPVHVSKFTRAEVDEIERGLFEFIDRLPR